MKVTQQAAYAFTLQAEPAYCRACVITHSQLAFQIQMHDDYCFDIYFFY